MISPQMLSRYGYFTAAGEAVVHELAKITTALSLPQGAVLFEEGDTAKALYVLVDGELDLLQTLGNGERAVVDTLIAGDLVGLSALAVDRAWKNIAKTTRDSRLLAIDAAALHALCELDPRLGYGLYKGVVDALNHRLNAARAQLAAAD